MMAGSRTQDRGPSSASDRLPLPDPPESESKTTGRPRLNMMVETAVAERIQNQRQSQLQRSRPKSNVVLETMTIKRSGEKADTTVEKPKPPNMLSEMMAGSRTQDRGPSSASGRLPLPDPPESESKTTGRPRLNMMVET